MRETIQAKLEELNTDVSGGDSEYITIGGIIPDDIVEESTTYFGYELSTTYLGSDLQKNYTYRQNITGYVVRLLDATENTREIVDEAVQAVINKLKELNFKCNSRDINISDSLIKVQVTGYSDYNEITNKFIV